MASARIAEASSTASTPSWATLEARATGEVETLVLGDGMILMLSQVGPATPRHFHFEEPDDVLGIGFHLMGGSAFDMDGTRFATKPLDIWAGISPRGARSTFSLPSAGFRTVSLRLHPLAAEEFFGRHGLVEGILPGMARRAGSEIAIAQLLPLGPSGAAMVESMFSTPLSGSARSLFLESCMLGLLADRIGPAGSAEHALSSIDAQHAVKARAYLDEHLMAPPTIIELARIVGTNDFKLKRAFKQAHGLTIFGYVRERRLERAAADIYAGLSVGAAALAAGYQCPRCFAQAFRRHYGVLPSQFTRSVRETPARHG